MSEHLSLITKGIIIGLTVEKFKQLDVEEELKKINKRGERSTIWKIWKNDFICLIKEVIFLVEKIFAIVIILIN